MLKNAKRVWISADHGLAIVYFLQSDVVSSLLDAGVEVVLLTDAALADQINARFGRPGLIVEDLRINQARQYFEQHNPQAQWWLDFLRRAGASDGINLQAVDSYVNQVDAEAKGFRKTIFPVMRLAVKAMRKSRRLRKWAVRQQMRFIPGLYDDLFDRLPPDLVIASTPGWRADRYVLREAAQRGIPTATAIVGWDNTSSYSLPGAPVDWITCWSNIQKDELVHGSDWHPERIHIGGIPSYDGYFRRQWVLPRDEYFRLHGLDPHRKLISFACSFITFSPNLQDVEALAELVAGNELDQPAQLLVRLHPNHFMDVGWFKEEGDAIRALTRKYPHVHVVEPVPLGGELGHYSGEDMHEKSSMMAHSDIFTTVYSTMVVEASAHGAAVLSVCIDAEQGWQGKYYLPLSKIGGWPTHSRFIESGAGKVAHDKATLRSLLNAALRDPQAHKADQHRFLVDECTYLDGSAGQQTAAFFLKLLGQ